MRVRKGSKNSILGKIREKKKKRGWNKEKINNLNKKEVKVSKLVKKVFQNTKIEG